MAADGEKRSSASWVFPIFVLLILVVVISNNRDRDRRARATETRRQAQQDERRLHREIREVFTAAARRELGVPRARSQRGSITRSDIRMRSETFRVHGTIQVPRARGRVRRAHFTAEFRQPARASRRVEVISIERSATAPPRLRHRVR